MALLSVAVGAAAVDSGRKREQLDRALTNEAREQSEKLDHYFARARSLTLVTAQNPAFRDFYAEPGARSRRIRGGGHAITETRRALAYLEKLFPGSLGEACFIDRGGAENARAVHGRLAPVSQLSPDESRNPFFAPTFALRPGRVYQARPYISPDTHDWVISNSTPIRGPAGTNPAIVHFEISLDSFRQEAANSSERFDVAIVEAHSGKVIADTRYRQAAGENAPLGRPFDDRFERFVSTGAMSFGHGTLDVDGRPSAFQSVDSSAHNANHWVVVASAGAGASSFLGEFGLPEIAMCLIALLLLGFSILSFRTSQARLRDAAFSDGLTGLPNRRRLMEDLRRRAAEATVERPVLLAFFDLDGFKGYNDSFGHPAGDALLSRLGCELADSVRPRGEAYRMGGDEFCVLTEAGEKGDRVLESASRALCAHGEGFEVTASHGAVMLPTETTDPEEALRAADQRMYMHKSSARTSAGRQSTDVLVQLISERSPEIGEHIDDVTRLCERVAEELELPEQERVPLLQAASLHDVGKAAVPDAIVNKPGPLDESEWAFMRQHTLVGERVLWAAPALASAAKLVRWSHERMDGSGYPDGLEGDEIPLGARVIAVCDAFDAMTTPRPYRTTPMSVEGALAELRRHAGAQFDSEVVEAFCGALTVPKVTQPTRR
jgi:diguanylate cyclase (GGDEF)-like protein